MKTIIFNAYTKKGSLTNIENYRNIAMQSCIPKIFDRLITDKIYFHVSKIIPRQPHGFMKNRSTTSNLMEKTQFLHQQMNNKSNIDIIYFDFSKAFDQVDHYLLAIKLSKISMPYLLFLTIMNFITNRSYILKCEGITYNFEFTTKSSVPQGSHCGPLLFLIMCKNIVECIHNLDVKFLQYADDTKFFKVVNNEHDMHELQRAVDNLVSSSTKNNFKHNHLKTKHVTYYHKNHNTYLSQYYIGLNRIQKVDQIRDLGVIFDECLTFTPHIEAIISRANCSFGLGYRFTRETRAPYTIIKIINCYITPIIEYCSRIWSQKRITIENKLEKVLHSGTRIALKSPRRNNEIGYISFQERMRLLNLITYKERRIISSIIFTLKAVSGKIDSIIVEEYLLFQNQNNNIRAPNLFKVPNRIYLPKSPVHMSHTQIHIKIIL